MSDSIMSSTLRSLIRDLFDGDRPPCLLVVEARPGVRARICRELASLGCATREARTPLEAIDRLPAERAAIDAVAIGRGSTQTRAEELAAYLREAYPDLPVVIVDDPPRSEQRALAPHPPGGVWSSLLAAA